ncbi:uncharacterized protein LOC121964721, partial [Plectropomus leopardus]|uniref:uncharacterized protein LOC121964721 n=1 Tax=Plectropomus leopardus TaxID=160734 RepID=UPI001C4ABFBD
MAAVKQLLWETLNDLSDRELDKFKEFLQLTVSQKDLTDISSTLSYITDKAKIVAEMVMTYGQQSVQLTAEVVKKMNRADLMHRLSKPSLKFKDKHSVDERQPAPQDKAAAKSAVKRILFLTFKYLSTEELEKFKLLLQFTYFQKGLPQISWRQLEWAEKAETLVDLMVQTCSQQPVDVAMEVFMNMNRTDLAHRLSVINSSLKVKLEPSKKEVSMSPVMQRLLGTLKDLHDKDLEQLKWLLQHFGMKKDEQNFLGRRMEKAGRVEVAELMEELYGLWSVKMIKEFLKEVGRIDLVQRLTEISSGSK